MKNTSLTELFFTSTLDENVQRDLRRLLRGTMTQEEILQFAGKTPFNSVYDVVRNQVAERLSVPDCDVPALQAMIARAITSLEDSDTAQGDTLTIRAALMQIATAVCVATDNCHDAKPLAANTLHLLSQDAKRKDEPFLAVFGALLYDMASMHARANEYRQAERAIEKSLKILERLSRENPERYAPAMILAQNAVANIDGDKRKQAELLVQYQAATSEYLRQLGEGIEDVSSQLIDSLFTEGKTLAEMGRHREAIQYYSRALKYLTRLNPVFDRRQLEMSIALGEALLNVRNVRDKGIHLLNTMLHKATKINADDLHRRIVDILLNAKNPHLDVLAFWHKIFPR